MANTVKKENKKTTKIEKKEVKASVVKKKTTVKKNEKKVEKKNEVVSKKSEVKKEAKKDQSVVFAYARYIDKSPQKMRLLIDIIRGKKALDAMAMMQFSNKTGARHVLKVVKSALANAKNNFDLDEKKLKIAVAHVDQAPTYKRGRAGSRGRYQKLLRRNCHITIGLKEQ